MIDHQFSVSNNSSTNICKKVLVFGARSDLGFFLLPALTAAGWSVFAFTRHPDNAEIRPGITWVSSEDFQNSVTPEFPKIPFVISLMPIWALSDHRKILEDIHANFLIAFSSTSIIAKENSSDLSERKIASLLQKGENWVAEEFGVGKQSAVIFRPTIIYGGPYNRNVNRIRNLIKTCRFFLLAGDGKGRRQPIHAEDLAHLCLRCLGSPTAGTRIYTLVGGQTLSYREMINSIFLSVGLKPRIVSLPIDLMRFLVRALSLISNQKDITLEMITRMDRDLCYDDDEATDQLNWNPRAFRP